MEEGEGGAVIWEHRDPGRNGIWRPYGPIMNAELELAYGISTAGSKTTIKYTCLGQTKTVHLEEMTEKCGNDGNVECGVRRIVTQKPEWFWDDGATWVRYDEEHATLLEQAHENQETSATLSIGRWSYEVTFSEGMFFQRNTCFGTVRPVLRVDFTYMFGPSWFEVGVWEDVLDVEHVGAEISESRSSLSLSDDEDDDILVAAECDTNADTCILCLDEFDDEKPAMRLKDCHGHYFHRQCDMHTNILHVIKLMGQCPVCSKSYSRSSEIISPVTPGFSVETEY